MTIARSEVVVEGVEAHYHCMSRCVRQAYLCGFDGRSGRSYEHRRAWVKQRLRRISAVFGIDVLTYAVMANHLHVVVRTRPDEVSGWSAEETARRWLAIFPKERDERGRPVKPGKAAIQAITAHPRRVEELRSRLGSVSWFMRCLNEHIARRANREDGCKGRFWEGRFKCQVLLDESAVLACMAYVDLNPIRAGLAQTPEDSDFTGIQDRIRARTGGDEDAWLSPLGDEREPLSRGVLPLDRDEYLRLVDWTGRCVRSDKRGAIPGHMADILIRLEINQERWVETVRSYGGLFYRAAGRMETMMAAARVWGKRWLGGVRAGKRAFSSG